MTYRFRTISLPVLFVFAFFASLATAQLQPQLSVRPKQRVMTKVDRKMVSALRGTHPTVVDNATIGTRLSAATQLHHVIMVLQPSAEQDSALQSLMDAQQDKNSPNYHKWLTPDTFGQSFGVAPADVAAVSAWLSDSGLSVESVSRGGRFLTFSGTVGAVETAFHTELHNVTMNGEAHISNISDISIPSALTPVVKGLARLDNFFAKAGVTNPQKVTYQKSTPNSVQPNINLQSGGHAIGAADLVNIYNAAPLINAGNTGKGITIAVLGRSNIALSDVAAYRAFFNLGANLPNIIVVGQDPGINNDDVEASLDAEMAGALASGATVDFIVSSASEVQEGIDAAGIYAVDNNVGDIITLSYGGCETNALASGTAFWNTLWEEAAAQGQTVFVSTGDSLATGCSASNATRGTAYGVNALGSSAFNVAVGGSMFVDWGPSAYWAATSSQPYGTALGYVPEAPWNEGRLTTTELNAASTGTMAGSGIGGAGGGISIFTGRPAWQTGSGISPTADPTAFSGTGIAAPIQGSITSGPHRLVPDLVFIAASNHDSTMFCFEGACSESAAGGLGSFFTVGGTSVATPAMASAQALIDAANGGRQGNANYYYYALANQQYTNSVTACQSQLGTLANPTVTLPATNCNFHDIITGSNIAPTATSGTAGDGFNALVGFDAASGLGSVNIANVANNWHTVTFNSTTTTMSISPTTLVHGSTQNFSVQVTSNNGTPSGDFSIIASPINGNGTAIQGTLLSGSFSGSFSSPLPGGTYTVSAHYAGDGVFAPSDSAPVTLTVSKEDSQVVGDFTATGVGFGPFQAVTVVSNGGANFLSGTTANYGTDSYMDTQLLAVSGSANGTPSGSVTYTLTNGNGIIMPSLTTKLDSEGTTYLLAGQPFPGIFLLPNYAPLPAGAYTVTASYAGDNSFNPSSASTSFTILPLTPTVALTTSTAQITTPGAAAILNFVISNTPVAGLPASGSVDFIDISNGTVDLGSAPMVGGKATLSTTAVTTAGAHLIKAVYTGDNNYKVPVTAPAVTVTVGATTVTTTTALAATGTTMVGSTVALAATVTPLPTGTASTVFFYDGSFLLGSGAANVTTGKATLNVANFTAGTHNLSAVFGGNSTHLTSTGTLQLPIAQNVTTTTVAGTSHSTYGQTVSFGGTIVRSNITVATAPAVGVTGSVRFFDGTTQIGSVTPIFGVGGTANYFATFSTTTLGAGSHTISAMYSGDANYTLSTSATVPLTVAKADQTISFTGLPATVAAGSPVSFTLNGTASSGLPVSYTVTGPATLSGTKLTITATGAATITVTASQAGNANYNAAPSVTQTIVVGTVQLTVSAVLSKTASGYQAVVTVVNNGTVGAQNVQLTAASLGAANATVLPAVLGSIPGGGSATVTLTFPSSAGAPGAGVVEKLTGTYTGGTFGGSFRATLPNSQLPS